MTEPPPVRLPDGSYLLPTGELISEAAFAAAVERVMDLLARAEVAR